MADSTSIDRSSSSCKMTQALLSITSYTIFNSTLDLDSNSHPVRLLALLPSRKSLLITLKDLMNWRSKTMASRRRYPLLDLRRPLCRLRAVMRVCPDSSRTLASRSMLMVTLSIMTCWLIREPRKRLLPAEVETRLKRPLCSKMLSANQYLFLLYS